MAPAPAGDLAWGSTDSSCRGVLPMSVAGPVWMSAGSSFAGAFCTGLHSPTERLGPPLPGLETRSSWPTPTRPCQRLCAESRTWTTLCISRRLCALQNSASWQFGQRGSSVRCARAQLMHTEALHTGQARSREELVQPQKWHVWLTCNCALPVSCRLTAVVLECGASLASAASMAPLRASGLEANAGNVTPATSEARAANAPIIKDACAPSVPLTAATELHASPAARSTPSSVALRSTSPQLGHLGLSANSL
mmetsp:Transcript_69568/g.225122  ORF Transcript_69568/g.225122 Transcript_69568/m.225122 type:complete len:252 (+) Transcript_69568:162-917(+)